MPGGPTNAVRSASAVVCLVAALSLVGAVAALPGRAATGGSAPGASPEATPSSYAAQAQKDAGVGEARSELESARRARDELQAALDRAAQSYEQTRAHYERLRQERRDSRERLEEAREQVEEAETAFAEQVAERYKQPSTNSSVVGMLFAPQRAAPQQRGDALVDHLRQQGPDRIARAQRMAKRAANRARQHNIVEAGVADAVVQRKQAAEELSAALERSKTRVAEAQTQVTDAKETAQRLAARRRRAAERRAPRDPAAGPGSGGPAPRVVGRSCPVGGPNGFSDSWGAARPNGRSHKGVDIFAGRGTPVRAVADGVATRVETDGLGGNVIHLVDEAGHRYYYAHLSAHAVSAGARVESGEVIGSLGNSGNARGTPPHLHFAYHPNDGPAVNPYPLARALCR
jgi:murein DD-endopeptidase MepM/ murein hydrolase activator NlpD